jgi:hypothetical protein
MAGKKPAATAGKDGKPKAASKPKMARSVGRPSAYKKEFAVQARKLTLLGATDMELADFFGVVLSTINLWKIKHPEFSESVKVGKDAADERVISSLFHRAIGFSHPEVDIRMYEGQIIKTDIVKQYPPDTTAAIFWLKNRRKDEFRDKVDVNHGVDPENPLGTFMAQLAGKTLKPVTE